MPEIVNGMDVEMDERNVQEVLQQSMNKPLLLAIWSSASKDHEKVMSLFSGIVNSFKERILFAKLNMQNHPMIARQLGATRIPIVKLIVQGQLLAEFTGSEPVDKIKALLERIVGPAEEMESEDFNLDQLLEHIQQKRVEKKFDEALNLVQLGLAQDEKNNRLKALLAHIYLDQDMEKEAQAILRELPEADPWKEQLKVRIHFLQSAKNLPPHQQLLQQQKQNPNDLEVLYGLGLYAVLQGDLEQAAEYFFSIFFKDRNFRNDAGKTALLDLITLLGPDDPLAKQYRRKLFSFLY